MPASNSRPPIPSEPEKPLIPAAVRYASAWSEICVRLSTRSNLNNYHIATITALTAVHFSIKEENMSHRIIIAVAIPMVSALFVMWYRHNDLIIGALSAYCLFFEKTDFESESKFPFPSWFYAPDPDGSIQFYVLNFRWWSDVATAILCFVSPFLALYDIYSFYTTDEKLRDITKAALYTGAIICSIISMILVYITMNIAKKRGGIIANARYDIATGNWRLPR